MSGLFILDTRYGQDIAAAESGFFAVDTRFSAGIVWANSDFFTVDTRAPSLVDSFIMPSPTAQGANVLGFRFPTITGDPYRVEYKDSLSDKLWKWLHTIIGDGRQKSFVEEIRCDMPHRFYRVSKETEQVNLYLRLPLPGGKSWYLTIEAGGAEYCNGNGDPFHGADKSYFALDFAPLTGGAMSQTNVPVLAAGVGVVVRAYRSDSLGWTVIIDHDAPYDEFPKIESGYTTRYAHLKSEPLVRQGECIPQGKQIGIMGNTGTNSTGVHLHFEVRYNGNSRATVSELKLVRLEGLPIEDFKVGCDPTGYYPSTNEQQ